MTNEQLKACLLTSDRLIRKYGADLIATMEKYEINTPLRQAHFLAQLGHESLGLVYPAEIASGKAYEGRADLGNLRPGDGVRFKGRGFIQITGRANYRMYGQSVGVDLESTPSLLELSPYCSDSAGWFWSEHSLNVFADKDDIKTIAKRINGGYTGLEDRQRRLNAAKHALEL